MANDTAGAALVAQFETKLQELRTLYTRLHRLDQLDALTTQLYGGYLQTTAEQWQGCRCFPSRQALMNDLPKGGIAAELGTQRGDGCWMILNELQPEKLYTIDHSQLRLDRDRFADELASGRLEPIEGTPSGRLGDFPDAHFDMIYIDAAHDYASVKREGEVAVRKIKPEGTIVFNDFNVFSTLEFIPYGVARAVIELAEEHGLRFSHFAFDYLGYHDIALRAAGV